MLSMKRAFGIFLVICLLAPSILAAATYTVTNTNDSGAGSLRQALTDANQFIGGDDNIVFQIPETDPGYDAGNGVWVIECLSQLPHLWDSGVTIDGNTQSQFIGTDTNELGPEIVIDGSNAGEAEGLYIYANSTAISGITIHSFMYDLIILQGDSNTVSGCYIGPGITGMERMASRGLGIRVFQGSYNMIGGPDSEDRNIISSNQSHGIDIYSDSHDNRIQNNYIGVTRDGSDTLSNDHGIYMSYDAVHNTIGPGNVISGNKKHGIHIEDDDNRVVGNIIGLDASGETDLGNHDNGLDIYSAAHTIIGGYWEGDRNIISGNECYLCS